MILAIDTSQMTYSIASIEGYCEWDDINITLYDQLSQYDLSKVSAIIINIGPGRFSGLRSGIAFAKGFSSAKSIPLIPVSRFDLIASKVSEPEFTIALDARKNQVFLKRFPNPTEIELIDQNTLGEYKSLYGNIKPCKIINTNAKSLLEYYDAYKPKPSDNFQPLYIRDSV